MSLTVVNWNTAYVEYQSVCHKAVLDSMFLSLLNSNASTPSVSSLV